MNVLKKRASFAFLVVLVGLSLLYNVAQSHAQTNDEAISYDASTKTVTIQGDCDTDQISAYMTGTAAQAETLHFASTPTITTKQTDTSPFQGCTSLKYTTADEDAHVSFAGNGGADPTLKYFFYKCKNLISLDGLSAWDVSRVGGESCMHAMFGDCEGLTSLDGLSAWDISNVTGDYCMHSMFCNCEGLTSLDGLSAWDVSNVAGTMCMYFMFKGCIALTTLDSLSAWDVSNVAGYDCMKYMFFNCSGLISLDGLSNWNLGQAESFTTGVSNMFEHSISLTSLTVGTFELKKSMYIPDSFDDNINTWWPEKGTSAGISTNEMYNKSKEIDTYGNRWVRSATNPYTNADNASIVWDVISKPYTGYNFRIGPTSVTLGGTSLKEGIDYYVLYTKEGSQKAYPVVREAGAYTAKLYFQGKYLSSNNPFYTQAVSVTGSPAKVTLDAGGGTFSDGSSTKELATTVGATLTQSDVETPVREGYDFTDWKDATGATISFPYVVTSENVSLTASWKVTPGPGPDPDPDPTPALLDGWNQSDAGWQYAIDGDYITGWYWIDDDFGAHWYYFNEDTYMATNQWMWDEANSSWYWLCPSGPMIRGLWQWIDNEWYGFWWDGKMCTGWVWDNAWQAWFYCYNNGIMARNTWEGPYWLNWEGVWVR